MLLELKVSWQRFKIPPQRGSLLINYKIENRVANANFDQFHDRHIINLH